MKEKQTLFERVKNYAQKKVQELAVAYLTVTLPFMTPCVYGSQVNLENLNPKTETQQLSPRKPNSGITVMYNPMFFESEGDINDYLVEPVNKENQLIPLSVKKVNFHKKEKESLAELIIEEARSDEEIFNWYKQTLQNYNLLDKDVYKQNKQKEFVFAIPQTTGEILSTDIADRCTRLLIEKRYEELDKIIESYNKNQIKEIKSDIEKLYQ